MSDLLNTREVARFLGVNEKVVYTLIAEKGLPATKVTGKWLFPKHLVETHTINYPCFELQSRGKSGIMIIIGSNNPLLDKAISLFNQTYPNYVIVFGNLGSLGGLKSLRQGICHLATSHLLEKDEKEYNFGFAKEVLGQLPVLINFCRREQGILVAKDNPKGIGGVADLARPGIRMVNRSLGTGTRLLLDRELKKLGIETDRIDGYENEVARHLDVGLEILGGRADAGLAVKALANLLNLDFIHLRWEGCDLLARKEQFFEKPIQLFLSLLQEDTFKQIAGGFSGYDLNQTGKMVFPKEN
nr:helix-turn-helix domain-containing protein [Desulfobacterales bacterium]